MTRCTGYSHLLNVCCFTLENLSDANYLTILIQFFFTATVQSKGISDAKPTKSNIKRVQSSHATVKPGKRDAQRTNTTGGRVVIPTARLNDKG